MFLQRLIERNPRLLKAAIELHQKGRYHPRISARRPSTAI
jgi:hypothetical protein